MFVDIYRSFAILSPLLNTRCNLNLLVNENFTDYNSDMDDGYNFNKYLEDNKSRFKNLENKVDKIIENENTIKYYNIKLITSEITHEWAKNWIYDMVNMESNFPQFMYQDMFIMRDYSERNKNPLYFYIAYFPPEISGRYGPYFISVFRLHPPKKLFMSELLIQNPNHIEDYGDSTKYLVDFKYQLEKLCIDSGVIFKFDNLKKLDNKRYYYTWLYEL